MTINDWKRLCWLASFVGLIALLPALFPGIATIYGRGSQPSGFCITGDKICVWAYWNNETDWGAGYATSHVCIGEETEFLEDELPNKCANCKDSTKSCSVCVKDFSGGDHCSNVAGAEFAEEEH